MNGRCAFRSVLVVLAALALVAPAYSQHGSGTVSALAIDPQTTTTLYAATPDRGVLKSVDGGRTWNPTALTDVAVGVLAIAPTVPATVYAATSDSGLLKSTDGGASWSATGLSTAVRALVVDAQTPSRLFAVTSTGLFTSTNSGESWTPTTLMNFEFIFGCCFPATATVQTVAIAPRVDPTSPATLYAGMTLIFRDAFTENVWGEAFKSTDGGSSWTGIGPAGEPIDGLWGWAPTWAPAPPTPTIPATVYTSWWYGACWTRDEGATFGCAPLPNASSASVSFLVVDPQTPTTVYAGTNLGVYKTTDAGAAWGAASTGLTATDIRALVIDPVTPATLYAATGSGVFKSTNGAATWRLAAESCSPEECANGIDDDCDGYVDAEDPDCGCWDCGCCPCPPGHVCGFDGCCVAHCFNSMWDGTEGDTDCGGDCPADCQEGQHCWTHGDCQSGRCWNDRCLPATPNPVSSVSLNPTIVPGGNPSTGTVTLSAAAPAGGAGIVLVSSDPSVATVPASVTVAAGATSAGFTVSTYSVTAAVAVTISGTYFDSTKSAVLTVNPPATLSVLSLDPTCVPGGTPSTGTVTLTTAAPAGGAVVALSSSDAAVATVPANVTVAAGATSANFPVSTSAACASATATISATYGGLTKSSVLTVTPAAADTVTIQRADYFRRWRRLLISATSSTSTATLQVFVTSSGELIGTLSNDGGGTYSGVFNQQPNPGWITVRSSSCGSATRNVRLR